MRSVAPRPSWLPFIALGLLPAACATRGSLAQPVSLEDVPTVTDDLGDGAAPIGQIP